MRVMKVALWSIWVLFFSTLPLFSQNSPRTLPVVPFQTNTPLIVSVSNKEADGDIWRFAPSENPSVALLEEKPGYLFTYFTIKVTDPTTTQVTFITDDGKKRSFPLHLWTDPQKKLTGQKIYGDIPSLKPSEGFLSQMDKAVYTPLHPDITSIQTQPNNIALPSTEGGVGTPLPENLSSQGEEPSTSSTVLTETTKTLDPTMSKKYIQKLIDNNLIPQAREVFDQLVAQPNIDPTWKYLTDLKLSRLANNYQDIVDKSSHMLSEDIPSQETELSIRNDKALALEKLNKIEEAESTLLYNTTYFPDKPEAYTNLADFYLRQKQYKKALEQLLYVLAKFPNLEGLDRINYQIANCYYNIMGNDGYNLALGYYKKVLNFGLESPYYKRSKDFVDFLENNLLSYR